MSDPSHRLADGFDPLPKAADDQWYPIKLASDTGDVEAAHRHQSNFDPLWIASMGDAVDRDGKASLEPSEVGRGYLHGV